MPNGGGPFESYNVNVENIGKKIKNYVEWNYCILT